MHLPMYTIVWVLALATASANAVTNLTSLVNLFIGTASGANGGSGGNAFPGAYLRPMSKNSTDPAENHRRGSTSCDGQSQSKSNMHHTAHPYVFRLE